VYRAEDVFTKPNGSVVVIVDDDQRVRESHGDLLCVAGFVVRIRLYRSDEEALQAGNLDSARCLVTDVHMQGMDGSELQWHVIATQPHLPIIFVTTHHDDAVRRQAFRKGAFAFLYKPRDGEELLAVIANTLRALTFTNLARPIQPGSDRTSTNVDRGRAERGDKQVHLAHLPNERGTMSINRRFAFTLLDSLLSTACAFAQQTVRQTTPPAQPPSGKITLDVVVTPKGGAPVPNLPQQDFTLLDNKTARSITSFRALAQSQEPAEVVLVIDDVNTGYQTIAYARPQIEKFLRANDGHLPYPTTLVVVTDTGTQIQQNATTDGNALSATFDQYEVGLKTLRRDTGIYGAEDRSDLGLRALRSLMNSESTSPGRKIILWVSPGWPLLSGPRLDLGSKQQQQLFSDIVAISTQLRDTRTTLYNINPLGSSEGVMRNSYYEDFVKGVQKPSQVDIGDLSLQVLATQSGGLVLNADNDITSLLRKAMADTSAYYQLSFDAPPAEHPDEYHHLQVQLNNSNLVGRTLQGYYAQPYSIRTATQP
jgi:VWFA-related protein